MSENRRAVPMKCGMDTAATASFVPSQSDRRGVRMLPIPKPAMDAIAPATSARENVISSGWLMCGD
jgi:hypothetical protein